MTSARIGDYFSIGDDSPLALIAGPCVLDAEEEAVEIARIVAASCRELGISYIFKGSFDKANRSSGSSARGPGLKRGLAILAHIKREVGVPVTTDVHEVSQVDQAAEIVDLIQIPAFLCRQTDLLVAAADTGQAVNVKKGPFLAPWDMRNVVEKLRGAGCTDIMLTERGSTFGYNSLVVDFRSLPQMQGLGVPVVFDATHSVQSPGGKGSESGGQREFVPHLARAATAVGIDGLFLEVHPDPDAAPSDGPSMVRLGDLRQILVSIKSIQEALDEL